jgi:hypothetical protein
VPSATARASVITSASGRRASCRARKRATDSDTIAERDYIVSQLSAHGVIAQVSLCRSGEPIGTEHVNHYITDGEITLASLQIAASLQTEG